MKGFKQLLGTFAFGVASIWVPGLVQAQSTISVEAGVLQPVGLFRSTQSFDELVKSGTAANLNLHVPLGKRMNLVATAGYWSNRLQLDDYELRQVPILLGVEYVFRPDRKFQPFLSLQPGLFITSTTIPESGTRAYLGAMGGVGAKYNVFGNWSVHVAGRFAYLLSQGSVTAESRTPADRALGRVQDLRYIPVVLGVSYRFYREEE